MQSIYFTKRLETARRPTRGSAHAAGYDLYAAHVEADAANKQLIVDTGLNVSFKQGHVMLVFGRSGLAMQHGIRPSNGVGVVDADYRGPLKVILRSDKLVFAELREKIHVGDRVAQAILLPIPAIDWVFVSELDSTERGENGFGSTGA